MQPQDLEEHRSKISFEVRVILSSYFQPHEDERVKTAQLAWWADELQDWEHRQVVWALRKWNADNPDRRPTPGHIVKILKHQRGLAEAAKMKAQDPPQEQPRAKLTDEERAERKRQADAIMATFRGN